MYKNKSQGWEIVVPRELTSKDSFKEFVPSDIELRKGTPIDLEADPKLKHYIDLRWEMFIESKRDSSSPIPTNGGLVRLSKLPFVNECGKLELNLAQTNYKEHIATCFPIDEYSSNLVFTKQANVLNSITAPITLDNYLVCSVRGNTATFDGTLSGFGKALKSAELILSKGSEYLFEQVRAALWQELGMSENDNSEKLKQNLEMHLEGFVYLNSQSHKGFNIPLWLTRTNLEKEQIQELNFRQEDGKYTSLEFVELKEEPFVKFLQRKNLTPSVRPIWAYLALKEFGPDFTIPE